MKAVALAPLTVEEVPFPPVLAAVMATAPPSRPQEAVNLALDIPAELHIYPVGGHGLGLATAETAYPNGYGIQTECETWVQLAGDWMKHLFEAKEKMKAPWE